MHASSCFLSFLLIPILILISILLVPILVPMFPLVFFLVLLLFRFLLLVSIIRQVSVCLALILLLLLLLPLVLVPLRDPIFTCLLSFPLATGFQPSSFLQPSFCLVIIQLFIHHNSSFSEASQHGCKNSWTCFHALLPKPDGQHHRTVRTEH